MFQTSDLHTVNSLTYADVAGLQVGLPRLAGEETSVYVDRLYRAVTATRDHSYEGALDQVNLAFGLTPSIAGQIQSADPMALMSVHPGQVRLGTSVIPTAILAEDGYLVWRTLGEVFADINATAGFSATLAADPALSALQLARQSSVLTTVNESVSSAAHVLGHAPVFTNSVRFNVAVPTWSIADNVLTITGAVPQQLTVSYQSSLRPFEIVRSDVGLFSLASPSLAQVAVSTEGVVAYQLRECIQTVMQTDRSYWSK